MSDESNPGQGYLGHVEPGGPPITRRLPGLTITKISVGPMDNNAYLLVAAAAAPVAQAHAGGGAPREALLIDAANDAERLLALLDGQQPPIRLAGILTTHRHADHWQALRAMVAATGAPVLAGAEDAAELPVPVARGLHQGDVIELGDLRLSVIALLGHTPGSVAIAYRDPAGFPHLFTGDSLFPGGPGRTRTPADFENLMSDLRDRVFDPLPDETWVYPGHGDDTTLGAERPHLDEWQERGW